MKIELKHLAPYLPYKLQMDDGGHPWTLKGEWLEHWIESHRSGEYMTKPILRPLSDLTKTIEHNGERFVPEEYFLKTHGYYAVNKFLEYDIEDGRDFIELMVVYKCVQKLLEWHFDVFGLIPKGLAIDINILDKK